MSDFLEDPLAMYEAAQKATEKELAQFNRLTREVFTSPKGKTWLTLAMRKSNFMGSTFSAADGFNPQAAAMRDGTRAFISEILNAAAAGKNSQLPEDDE